MDDIGACRAVNSSGFFEAFLKKGVKLDKRMTRKAKIVATIGPASQSEEVLEKLVLAGMDVARMNFSHGTHEEHEQRIALIRKVADRLGVSVGVLQDLQGPKIRVGALAEPVQL